MDQIIPTVSIIINCYNGEKYLREAINSVLAQSSTNWEIIFWDNQSSDKSAEIFNSYSDTRLRYFYAPTHTLLYEARNFALAKAQGEFIAFLDVDDWWEIDKLEQQILLFDDREVGLVYGNFWLVDTRRGNCKTIGHLKVLPEGRVLNKLLNEYVIGMPTMVIRRRTLDELDKVFDSRFQIIGDFDLATRLAVKWKIACIQTPVASYRCHGGNLSILEAGRWFAELEIWFAEMKNHPVIGSQSGYANMRATINYLEIMNSLMQGKRLRAFVLFWRYPTGLRKLRLFVAFALPLSILKALRS